jgi:hypothetical protein
MMVFVVQQLVVCRDLYRSSRLTSLHDSNLAWQGLGGAIMTLYRQKQLPDRVWSAIAAAFYLGGIATLHATIPALYSVQVFNTTLNMEVATRGMYMIFNLT